MRNILNHWTTPFLRRPAIPPQATPLRSLEPGDSREIVENIPSLGAIMREKSSPPAQQRD